jgi:tight adherence protein B
MLGVGLLVLGSAVTASRRPPRERRPRLAGDRLLTTLAGAVGAGVSAGWLTSDQTAAVVVGLLGGSGALLAREVRERRRRRALLVAWPVAVDALLDALQAGLAPQEAWATAGRHAPLVLRGHLAVAALEIDATGDPVRSLQGVRERLGDPHTDRVVEAILLGLATGQTVRLLRLLADELRRDAAASSRGAAPRAGTRAALAAGALGPWALLAAHGDPVPWSPVSWSPVSLGLAAALVAAAVLADRLLLGPPAPRVWQ